jgi:thiol-disulfide isomerase/thioredoxin
MSNVIKWLLGMLCAATWAVQAQTPLESVTTIPLQSVHLHGEKFNPLLVQGKVHVVFFWSTGCAICRDSLPELRANQNGWRNKPFALVTVNVDKRHQDWQAYERIVQQTQMPDKSLIALWHDTSNSPLSKLPLTLLVDSKGKVVSRIEGRIAPEVWDAVAELL